MKCFQWVDFAYNVSQGSVCIIIINFFIFCRFRLVSTISYTVETERQTDRHRQTERQRDRETVFTLGNNF